MAHDSLGRETLPLYCHPSVPLVEIERVEKNGQIVVTYAGGDGNSYHKIIGRAGQVYWLVTHGRTHNDQV
jgi:hypothetical protein